MAITNGQVANADEVMNSFGKIFKNQAQLLYNAKYIGYNENLNVDTGVPNLKNTYYSIFDSDEADYSENFVYDADNDYYTTVTPGSYDDIYMIIEADDDTISWSENDCELVKIGTGIWLIYCTTGTDAVKRAQIHKSLWFGTDGTDALIDDFTSVTKVQTTITRDIGKRAHLIHCTLSYTAPDPTATYVGTFSNTTDNTDFSSWLNQSATGAGGWAIAWYVPQSTAIYTAATFPESFLGTDREIWERDNPADCKITMNANSGGGNTYWSVLLSVGSISWVNTDMTTATNVDYYDDSSIPLITAISEDYLTSTLIFKDTTSDTITNAIMTMNYSIDATSSVQLSLSADGTNWTDVNDSEIVRPTNTGTSLWRRIVITRTDFSKIDKVSEEACIYNLY